MPTYDNPDADKAVAPAGATAETELILLLVRHGETAYNREGRIQGHRDVPLSEAGREQACRLAQRLARVWGGGTGVFPVAMLEAIFASDLSRASETADILRNGVPALRDVPFTTTPLLRERSYGTWEGLTVEELRTVRAAQRFVDEPPGGETWPMVKERMERALAHIRENTGSTKGVGGGDAFMRTAVVVGHGGSLRMLFCRALGVSPEAAQGFRLGNTSISALALTFRGTEVATSKGRILLVNDTAHLESAESDLSG